MTVTLTAVVAVDAMRTVGVILVVVGATRMARNSREPLPVPVVLAERAVLFGTADSCCADTDAGTGAGGD